MAFLDSQIDKVQNSHGRKVEGTGGRYRTIINCILIAKSPAPQPATKKDAPKSAASNAQAQGRPKRSESKK
jgi:hypothetical protein